MEAVSRSRVRRELERGTFSARTEGRPGSTLSPDSGYAATARGRSALLPGPSETELRENLLDDRAAVNEGGRVRHEGWLSEGWVSLGTEV